jgi:uncharacterized protein YuzB (UPF0349 family)
MNLALLAKRRWQLLTHCDSLRKKVLRSKHGELVEGDSDIALRSNLKFASM